MISENRGLLSFLAGLGFAFMVPYIGFFTWLKPWMWFVIASGIIAGIAVPLILFAIFNNDVWSGFIGGMFVMTVLFVIVFSFICYGDNGIHSLVVSLVSPASVYSFLYAARQR
jgi:hypothetical protein